MKFTKMHGLGNDFVVVAEFSSVPEGISELAQQVCDRHFGIGADGLVLVLPHEQADFAMRIFNADGTEAEQCGNAVRCVAKYVYDKGLTDRPEVLLETRIGIQRLQLFTEAGQVTQVTVDMGEPILTAEKIPTTAASERVVNHQVTVADGEFPVTAVSMGNPHAVIFLSDLATVNLHQTGPQIETHPFFPRKTNVEFVQVNADDDVTMHVWERGCGETLACGSGACAVVVAGVLTGKTSRETTVHLKGGDLRIEWREADNRVYMTGPSVIVFEGDF
ncbi:diaminopimelate epimerase [Tumebacillus algifaecis]|uniref:Diaminopimelate epimerase n=1 Tax=Tumebacillus algifaecis TaxID=1214604 RepID=A0A223D2B6_9BACL|nr:diaminopimelate epimerase [Tumebacillus algifaecis]ASS75730.1 diaminopimelate epimerase [Tumebacillus algifaecis]